MNVPPRLPVLMCACLALASPGWGQSETTPQPDAEKLARLRAAKTVRIDIKQRYAFEESEEDTDSDQKQRWRKSMAALRQVSLPLTEEARRVCDLLGLRVLAVGQADLILRIDVAGEPVQARYNNVGDQYSGAILHGSILVRDRSGELLAHEFHYEYRFPTLLVYTTHAGMLGPGPHARPEDAPFDRTLPGFRLGLLELAALGWGAEPLGRALKAQNPGLRAAAACVLGGRRGAELKAAVPRLALLLEDTDDQVRAAAAWALGESDDPTAVPSLLTALDKLGIRPEESKKTIEPTEEEEPTEDLDTDIEAVGDGADVFQDRFAQDPHVALLFIRAALHKLTGEGFASAAEWRRWWSQKQNLAPTKQP